jgi:hypothetical protein
MTSSDGLKSVVSCNGSMPRKPFNINHFGSFNSKGLLYGSAGHVSQEAVRRYINEQQGKDVLEYSIFGNNEVKIGDFTQSKLEGF